jgi:hypothetical protein
MKLTFLKRFGGLTLLAIALASPLLAQNARVDVGKHSRPIPKSCENVTPANIDGAIGVPALVKEAICRGAGDMLADFTYTVNSLKREKDKKGKVKEETYVYEVFIPTLKSGTRTKGVLVVTSHNGVAVPPRELEKARLEAAERIEKEENKIARTETPPTKPSDEKITGILPHGMYTRTSISRSSFGSKKGGVTLAIADFLRASDLVLARREIVGGRYTLVFNFVPRAGTQFIDNEKYMAQVTGEIWIDVTDRIVIRLIGWPAAVSPNPNGEATLHKADEPPAIMVEMMRLPEHAIWLPRVIRINGADYQTLFDGIKTDSTSTYSNYIRFSSDVKDAEVGPQKNP